MGRRGLFASTRAASHLCFLFWRAHGGTSGGVACGYSARSLGSGGVALAGAGARAPCLRRRHRGRIAPRPRSPVRRNVNGLPVNDYRSHVLAGRAGASPKVYGGRGGLVLPPRGPAVKTAGPPAGSWGAGGRRPRTRQCARFSAQLIAETRHVMKISRSLGRPSGQPRPTRERRSMRWRTCSPTE
jgi:hypothetical protein